MPGFREHGIGRRMQHRRAARNPALLANQVGAWQLTEQPVPAGRIPVHLLWCDPVMSTTCRSP